MKTKIIIISIFLCFASLFAEAGGVIKGTVSDDLSGNSISEAEIKLFLSGIVIRTTKSGKSGNFQFTGLNPGKYSLRISKTNYEDYLYKEINITQNQTYSLTAFLIPQNTLTISDETKPLRYTKDIDRGINRISEMESYNIAGSPANIGTGYIYQSQDTYVDYNTESYDYIAENNFKAVLNNPLSTFSIDIDRASYANVRRFINNSQLPPKDAVRIEEMINYFDYDYESPKGEHPFSTYLEIGDCPWNPANKLLMIGIQGESVPEEKIPPSNLVFLIDVSGSMSPPNKLPLLKKSFRILIDRLRPEDQVSIVVYAGAAGCVLPPTSGDEKNKIIAALDNLQAGGSTAGGAGIKLAYKLASENFIEGGNNRVILASDGDFNVGVSSNAELERLIESKRDLGVYLTILGFGMGNYKDSRFENISNKGNGNYAYIDNISEANKVFGHELWGTLYTIANDVKIQIEFNPAKVKEYRLVGYENRLLNKEDFNDDKKDAGDIGSGHTVTAIYELVMADGNSLSADVDPLNYQTVSLIKSNDIISLKIRYKKPGQTVSRLITSKVSEKDMTTRRNTDNFIMAVAVAEFGLLLRDSEFKAKASYESIISNAKKVNGNDRYGYRTEFISLVERAKLIASN